MFGLGMQELIVIFLIVFLLFGAKALPEIAKGLGQAIRSFKKEAKDISEGLGDEVAQERPSGRSQENDSSPDGRNGRSHSNGSGKSDPVA